MNVVDGARLSQFRSKLRARARVLHGEIRQALLRSDDERYLAIAEQARDLEDDALADLLVDINLAEIDRDVGELRDVEAALRRMNAANYGLCDRCGEPIDIDRLEANPAAARCLACQTEQERMRVQTPTL